MSKTNNKLILLGFTLIELLVVIAIIGILIGTGTASYQRAVRLSRDSRRKTDLEQIRQALETYRSENSLYPESAGWEAELTGTYITTFPTDPRNNLYDYVPGVELTTYTLCAALEIEPETAISSACDSAVCGETCNYEVANP